MPDHRKCPRDPNRLGKLIVDLVTRQGDTLIADQVPPQEVWRLGSVTLRCRDEYRRLAFWLRTGPGELSGTVQ
jgi:hypothetical protein